ncbi:MAG TPA: hypothetical protein VIU40_13925 [Geobacteraceae bacterium]
MPLFPRQLRDLRSYDYSVTNIPYWWRNTGQDPIFTAATWSTANLAVYTPIVVEDTRRLTGFSVWLGATQSGLIQCGIYEPDSEGKPGLLIARTSAVIQPVANASEFMFIPLDSVIWLGRGTYFVACVMNNTTGTVTRLAALTTDGDGPVMAGIFTEASAYPLPAAATPNLSAVTVNVPVMGIY